MFPVRLFAVLLAVTLTGPSVGALVCDSGMRGEAPVGLTQRIVVISNRTPGTTPTVARRSFVS
jgi:hypothetical protein